MYTAGPAVSYASSNTVQSANDMTSTDPITSTALHTRNQKVDDSKPRTPPTTLYMNPIPWYHHVKCTQFAGYVVMATRMHSATTVHITGTYVSHTTGIVWIHFRGSHQTRIGMPETESQRVLNAIRSGDMARASVQASLRALEECPPDHNRAVMSMEAALMPRTLTPSDTALLLTRLTTSYIALEDKANAMRTADLCVAHPMAIPDGESNALWLKFQAMSPPTRGTILTVLTTIEAAIAATKDAKIKNVRQCHYADFLRLSVPSRMDDAIHIYKGRERNCTGIDQARVRTSLAIATATRPKGNVIINTTCALDILEKNLLIMTAPDYPTEHVMTRVNQLQIEGMVNPDIARERFEEVEKDAILLGDEKGINCIQLALAKFDKFVAEKKAIADKV
jgi:hypothetical protein